MSDYLLQFLAFGVIALLVVLPATFGAGRQDIVRRFLRTSAPDLARPDLLRDLPLAVPGPDRRPDLGVTDWWPSMQFPVLVLVTLAGTIACAAISYYALERPLMRWGRRSFGSPPPGPASPATPDKPATS